MSRQEEVEPGQGSLVWAEFLPEEGVLLLRVLTPEEVFRLIYGSIGQTMEIKLSTLRDELSPEIVDNAIQGIVQGLTGESESSSRSPLTPQKGKLCRSAMWKKIKQLYHKLNLFEPSMGGACGLKLPTPKLKRPKRKGRQKKASEKKTSEPDLEEEEEEEQVTGCFLRSGKRCADDLKTAGATMLRKSCEKVENVNLKQLIPCMEPGKMHAKKLKTAGATMLRKSCEKVQNVNLKQLIPCMEPGESCAKKVKTAGATMVKKSCEKVQNVNLKQLIPCMEPGKSCAKKVKTAGATMVKKSCEKFQNVNLKQLITCMEPGKICSKKIKTAAATMLREVGEKVQGAEPDEAEILKTALIITSLTTILSNAVVKAGFEDYSDKFHFPVKDYFKYIWEEVKDEIIQMDQAKIVNKLPLLVYKDLIKECGNPEVLLIFLQSNALNDFIALSFKKHLTKLKKPSLFRRVFNFFCRKSD